MHAYERKLRFADRAEQFHLLFDFRFDRFGAGSEQLAGVKALALLVLAGLDVLAGRFSEYQLALGVDVDLRDAERDGFLDLVVRDAGAAVENEGHVADRFLDSREGLEGEAFPVGGVDAMDVADAGRQHGDAEVGDHLAFCGIRALALADNAVFLTADGADFRFQRKAEDVAGVDQLGGNGSRRT